MSDRFRNDFTQGSVTKQLIRFSFPLLLSNLLQALYSVVDMVVVGKFCGKASITGVSIGGQINILASGLALGLSIGGTVLIAQYGGSKKYGDQRKTIGTMTIMYFILSAVVTSVMLSLSNPILKALNTPDSAYSETLAYFKICMYGTIFVFMYNAISAILRGMGDSKRPLYFVFTATVTNMLLDIVLVGYYRMGAAGAAWATIFSQALSVVLSLIFLFRKDFFIEFRAVDFKPDFKKAAALIKIGFPSAVQNIIVSFSFLALTSIVNSLPNAEVASACQGIGSKVNSFAILPGLALSTSISSMAGQNIGAGEYGRAKRTFEIGTIMAFGISLLVFLVVQLFPGSIMALFTSEADVISTGSAYLRRTAYDYLFVSITFSVNGLALAAGMSNFALLNTIFNSLILRIPLTYFFVNVLGWGFNGVGLAIGLAPLGSWVLCAVFLKKELWKKKRINL
ncbi:MAG: MATE family efflux transporter [Clostridiales bacterium]|jgi:putative MATE family efflux protein|nr:MATE family efflux transporter [Clostridiales bacterium]